MNRNLLRLSLSYVPLALGIWACGVAAAQDATQSRNGARTPSTGTPSQPVDAPPTPRKPPQEAFDACKSLAEGDACSVSFNGHTMNGTCRKGPNGEGELVCAPPHPAEPPPTGSSAMLSDSALERKLDQLERDLHGT
jgi:hypothetical protein